MGPGKLSLIRDSSADGTPDVSLCLSLPFGL